MNASESLDNSADEAPAESCMPTPAEFVRWSEDRLSDASDTALRQYEAECFHRLQSSNTTTARDEWLHALAAAIVHLSNRGLSLGGKQ